ADKANMSPALVSIAGPISFDRQFALVVAKRTKAFDLVGEVGIVVSNRRVSIQIGASMISVFAAPGHDVFAWPLFGYTNPVPALYDSVYRGFFGARRIAGVHRIRL
ncbi:MAG: hypothetical protein LC730_03910, partial [Acidobacteria bacterium]|nr:hypothetical protein [Acidobacteriota bacterium]MCA1608592.1 hypothetical protein [Acidobacteriota bacterium]